MDQIAFLVSRQKCDAEHPNINLCLNEIEQGLNHFVSGASHLTFNFLTHLD
jgi:hypothetical protein